MKIIEDQLINAFRETPLETDCSVSITALEMAGVKGQLRQLEWLASKRPAAGARQWHLRGEHWHFGVPTDDDTPTAPPTPVEPLPLRPPRTISPIIVKPVRAFATRVVR